MKRIGILAGTFDPVHNGHLEFANAALGLGLEKVWFLVEPRPRRKQGVRSLKHRQAMVELAIKDNDKLGLIDLQQARFDVEKTLPALGARYPGYKLTLLFGEDVVRHIADWPGVSSLVQSVDLLIAARATEAKKIAENMEYLENVRGLKFKYGILPANNKLSSSAVRVALKKKQPTTDVPRGVIEYIAKNRLYVSSASK